MTITKKIAQNQLIVLLGMAILFAFIAYKILSADKEVKTISKTYEYFLFE